MILTGEMNLSWIRFKDRYLFSLNVGLAVSLSLYFFKKDFQHHWIPLLWMTSCFVSDKLNQFQLIFFKKVGHFNSLILLSLFYFLFFSPFSIIYKLFFIHSSFETSKSYWIKKDQNCDFDRPF